MDNNIRFVPIGRVDGLLARRPARARTLGEQTAGNTGLLFKIALNYGGRAEIVDAVNRSRRCAADGDDAATIDEELLRRPPLHGRPARSRPADPHERRDARQQLPALADRLRRDLRHRRRSGPTSAAGTCSRRSSTTRRATAAMAASASLASHRRQVRPSARHPGAHSRQPGYHCRRLGCIWLLPPLALLLVHGARARGSSSSSGCRSARRARLPRRRPGRHGRSASPWVCTRPAGTPTCLGPGRALGAVSLGGPSPGR